MAVLNGKSISKEELLKKVGNIGQIASIKPYEMNEGRAKGIKAFDVSTGGGLDFTVLESKCLDLLSMKYKGTNLSFLAKPGVVSPEYFNPSWDEFSRYFQGGMLYTCGLSNIGLPCLDEGDAYSLHGRISHTPAEKVSAAAKWEEDEYVMTLTGEMREVAHFKENLVLKREIVTKLGAKSIKIHDVVENEGAETQPVMLLYHFNFGYPLLDENTRVVVPESEIRPRTEVAKAGMDEFAKSSKPIDGFQEHVFYIESKTDEENYTYAALVNDKLELGVYIKYNKTQLPILIEWKSMASGDYALGLEPGTNELGGRAEERSKGALKMLSPYKQISFDLEVGILDGSAEIDAFINKLK